MHNFNFWGFNFLFAFLGTHYFTLLYGLSFMRTLNVNFGSC